jgi:hypothetical protein
MFEGVFDQALLLKAAGLNVLYIVLGIGVFQLAFYRARQLGLLLHIGE